ncbi:MAG: hypothetical protein JRJ38_07930 [Deltaproteobacteria bacterium]|nr:hypothetical protein [Deltaproteobacteria bacterium]
MHKIAITHCSEANFLDRFRVDLAGCMHRVTILSPFLSQNRAISYYPVLHSLLLRRVVVDVYARPKNEQPETLREHYEGVARTLKRIGVRFHVRPGMHEKVGIIDSAILWHGSLNILSHNDTKESMLRFESPDLVREILEDIGITVSYQVDPEHLVASHKGDSGLIDRAEQVRTCPRCKGTMHFFSNAGLWICNNSPRCPGILPLDSSPPTDRGNEENKKPPRELELRCPLCGAFMEIKREVFTRAECASKDCGFSLDHRLSASLDRILRRRA